MSLSYKKLIQFDLLDAVEKNLMDDKEKFFEFFSTIQGIIAADRFIRDCPSFPGSNKTIIRNELVSAIGSTLAIEGIIIKEDEIKETLQKPSFKDNIKRKQQETLNSQNVYDYIQDTVNAFRRENDGKFIYKDEYIINIHRKFTENIDYIGNRPGAYRNTSASFGDPRKISLCRNYSDIYAAMKNYVDWLNQKKDGFLTGDTIVKAIMAHYYLTEIHPFGDGNGRTARAIEAMVLYANGINPYCFWSLANFWSAHRNEYITHLGNIRETCNPFDFIMWGAKGYLEEIDRIKTLVLNKLKSLMLRDYVSWLLKSKNQQRPEKKINRRIHSIVFLLTDYGRIPFDKFRASPEYELLYANLSSVTKTRDLDKMKSLELVRIPKEDDGKVFIEPNYEILKKLNYGVS